MQYTGVKAAVRMYVSAQYHRTFKQLKKSVYSDSSKILRKLAKLGKLGSKPVEFIGNV